jgi:hypothetical protein
MMPLLMAGKVTVLAKMWAGGRGYNYYSCDGGGLRLMWLKLHASSKFLTRQMCEHVEFRLYLGGWRLFET